MALRILAVITLASVAAVSTQVSARAPAPLVPTALVEDVKSATADVEFMDYVGSRQVIKLGPSDVLVLSYLKSANMRPSPAARWSWAQSAATCKAVKSSGPRSPVTAAISS